MKYLETIHERNSAKITALIAVILILLLFVMGNTYMDPPEEYGVAINFGNSSVGSGKVQPTEPIKSRVNDDVVKEEKQAEKVEKVETPTEASSKAEDVMTNESAEAIAIKKAKEAKAKADAKAKAKAKADAERKEKLRQEAEAKKAKEEQDKKDKLDALIGGVKNSDGPTNDGEGPGDGPGDKGDLDGNPYAPYDGIPGAGNGGVGYGLNGRGKATYTPQDGCENEYGRIVVDILVDRSGKVIKAEFGRGSTNVTDCLKKQALKIAKSYKWPADSKAPAKQPGKVVVNFSSTN